MEVFVVQALAVSAVEEEVTGWLYKIFSTKEKALDYLNQYAVHSRNSSGVANRWKKDFGQYYICDLKLETWAVDDGETE